MINHIIMKDSIMTIYEAGYTAVSYLFLFLTTSPDSYSNFNPIKVVLLLIFGSVAAYGTLKLLFKRKK